MSYILGAAMRIINGTFFFPIIYTQQYLPKPMSVLPQTAIKISRKMMELAHLEAQSGNHL